MITEARNLKVGDKYTSRKMTFVVTKIVAVTEKTIEFRSNRIAPDYYEGDFFNRPHLSTKYTLVN